MKERPILFSAPMVRAILDGRKTQTRRVVKPIKLHADHGLPMWDKAWNDTSYPPNPCLKVPFDGNGVKGMETTHRHRCPHGLVGDRLWVREVWCQKYDDDDRPVYNSEGNLDSPCCWYKESNPEVVICGGLGLPDRADGRERSPWGSPIHMPRWASRLTLEITGVRVERLQAISEADAIAEGIRFMGTANIAGMHIRQYGTDEGWVAQTAAAAYSVLLDSINGKGSWAANPWVWVIEFRRVQV